MSVDDFFERLIAALERAAVPYMVTGSPAVNAGRAIGGGSFAVYAAQDDRVQSVARFLCP
jgi:hypothetical protein